MAATETSARASTVLDELYRHHVGDVYRYTYAVLGNHADAEDVTQTTFVNALRALERGERPDDPSRWLVVIAHNLVRQRWRQAAARPALVELGAEVPAAGEDDEALELGELVRALQRIPETQREAIVMRELEGRSYREIAAVLGLSTSALETLLFRARRSLAEELENVVTCQNAELSLSKRLDGRLSRKERRRLDEHLAECPDCARLAAAQQRQRRAFKGLALLPLPIGLALFKGAPSAAAATTLPTIGLGTAGASGTGAGTTAGGAVAGGSLAGGIVVKVAAVTVAAALATGVAYKGVQAARKPPAKPVPAHVKQRATQVTAAAARVAPTGAGPAKVVAQTHAKAKPKPKRDSTPSAKAVPGAAVDHGATAAGRLGASQPGIAAGSATGAGQDTPSGPTQATAQGGSAHATASTDTPAPQHSSPGTKPHEPVAPRPGPGKDEPAAPPPAVPPETLPPAAAVVVSQPPEGGGPTAPTATPPAGAGAAPSIQAPAQAPPAQTPPPPSPPASSTPPPPTPGPTASSPTPSPTTPPATPPAASTPTTPPAPPAPPAPPTPTTPPVDTGNTGSAGDGGSGGSSGGEGDHDHDGPGNGNGWGHHKGNHDGKHPWDT
ncbi:MAG TPA: sigma-70 family RNA polymerase sigma factor [Gaiella sp.]